MNIEGRQNLVLFDTIASSILSTPLTMPLTVFSQRGNSYVSFSKDAKALELMSSPLIQIV